MLNSENESGFLSMINEFSAIDQVKTEEEKKPGNKPEDKFDSMAKMVGQAALVKPKKKYEEKFSEKNLQEVSGPAYQAGIPKHSKFSLDEWMSAVRQNAGKKVFEYWANSKAVLISIDESKIPGDIPFFFDKTILVKSGVRSDWENQGYKASLLVCSGSRILVALDPERPESLLYSGCLLELKLGNEPEETVFQNIETMIPN